MGAARTPVLVGRDMEMAELRAAAERALSGGPFAVVVEGEPGIGKSRLAGELLAELSAAGWLTVTGHGIDLGEGAVAYGVAAEILAELFRQFGLEKARAAFGRHIEVLGPLAPPELSSGVNPAPDRLDRLSVYASFRAVLQQVSQSQRLCLLVEDLHWADVASVDLLTYVAKTMQDSPVLTVATIRPMTQEGQHVSRQVAELTRDPVGQVVLLGPLDRAAVERQAAGILGRAPDDGTLSMLHRLGDGVPLYVEELLRPRSTGTTGAFGGLDLTGRLAGLEPRTRRVLDAAAVGEGRLTVDRLCLVTGWSRDTVVPALAEAVQRGLIETAIGVRDLRFHHALLREAVLRALLPDDRRAWHRKWAEALGEDAVACAHHWYESDDPASALSSAVRAAEQTAKLEAPFEAAVQWRRVLDLWWQLDQPEKVAGISRHTALNDGATAVAQTLDWAGVLALVDKELARTVPADPVIELWGRLVRERAAYDMGVGYEPAVGPDEVDATVTWLCEQPLNDDLVVGCLGFLGHTRHQVSAPTFDRIVARIDQAQRAVEGTDEPPRWSLPLQAERALCEGDLDRALRIGRDRHDLAERRGAVGLARAKGNLALCLSAAGEYERAAAVGDQALTNLQDEAAGGLAWRFVVADVAPVHFALGAWERCRQLALPLLDQPTSDGSICSAAALLADLALARGEWDEADVFLGRAFATVTVRVPELPNRYPRPRISAAGLALARGRLNQAQHHLREVLEMPTLDQGSEVTYQAALLAARVAVDHADAVDDDWSQLVAERSVRIHRYGRLGKAWDTELRALLGRAQGADTITDWERAVTAWADIGHVYNAAACRVRLARRYLEVDQPAAAHLTLQQALDAAEGLCAVPLADEVRRLASAGRLRLNGQAAARPDVPFRSLTEREVEVLRLVAQGDSNAQIASALFMSPKTASVHVSRIIAKLGAANRTEAATVALRSGLLDR